MMLFPFTTWTSTHLFSFLCHKVSQTHTVLCKSFRHPRCLDSYALCNTIREVSDRSQIYSWHDNDPKHTARVIKNYFQQQEEWWVLQQMVWYGPHRALISTSWSQSGITWRSTWDGLNNKSTEEHSFSRMVTTTYLQVTMKNCVKVNRGELLLF